MAVRLSLACVLFAIVMASSTGGAASAADDLPAGVAARGPLTIPGGERYTIQSNEVGKPFLVEVVRTGLPGMPSPPGGLPVVFVTDNDTFSAVVPAMIRSAPGLFPPMIVVGIGYEPSGGQGPLSPFVEAGVRRAEDFTPTDDKTYKAFTPMALQLFRNIGVPAPEPRLGRADAFLAFIDRELKPFLAARYPVDAADTTLVGHSMGGLFALHVLFTSPESFKRYVILSPAVQYGDGIVFREEAARGDIAARVFMGIGEQDAAEIVEGAPRLDARLRAGSRPGLRYTYRQFPGENHLSVYPGGVMAGLRAVFDPPALPGGASLPFPATPTEPGS